MSTNLTDNYFEYGVNKYFRGNAHLLEIGSYGEKKDPIGAKSYIDPQNKIQREHLETRVIKGTMVTISFSSYSQAAVEVNGTVKVFGINVSGGVSYSYSKLKTANLKLFNLSITEGSLKSCLNTQANGTRNYLKDEGNDARVVSEVWVVMEAELAEHFESSTVTSAAVGSVLNVTASGGSLGRQTIAISAGTTFAYKSHKVKRWDGDKVEDLEADYYGMS